MVVFLQFLWKENKNISTHYVYRETPVSTIHGIHVTNQTEWAYVSLILTGSWHMGRLLSPHPATWHTLMPQPSLQPSPSEICWYMLHGQHSIEVHEITYGWLACTMTSYYTAEEGTTKVTQLQNFRIKSCMALSTIYQLFVMLQFTTHNLLFSLSPAVDIHVKKKKKEKRLDLAILFPDTHSTSFPKQFFLNMKFRINYFSLQKLTTTTETSNRQENIKRGRGNFHRSTPS